MDGWASCRGLEEDVLSVHSREVCVRVRVEGVGREGEVEPKAGWSEWMARGCATAPGRRLLCLLVRMLCHVVACQLVCDPCELFFRICKCWMPFRDTCATWEGHGRATLSVGMEPRSREPSVRDRRSRGAPPVRAEGAVASSYISREEVGDGELRRRRGKMELKPTGAGAGRRRILQRHFDRSPDTGAAEACL